MKNVVNFHFDNIASNRFKLTLYDMALALRSKYIYTLYNLFIYISKINTSNYICKHLSSYQF